MTFVPPSLGLGLSAGVAALHHLPQPGAPQLGLEVPVRRGRGDALLVDLLQAGLSRRVEVLDQARAQAVLLLRVLACAAQLGEMLLDDLPHRPNESMASLW